MINNLRWIGVLGAFYVACAAVGTAQASGPDDGAGTRGPGAIEAAATATGTMPMWLAALDERSAALNREYGLGDHVDRRQLGAADPKWLVSLSKRSKAMNRAHGLGEYRMREAAHATPVIHADDRSGLRGRGAIVFAAAIAPTVASSDGGFAWDEAALSAVATLAVGILLGAGAVSIRYRRGLTLR
jgi:hypothetical protein